MKFLVFGSLNIDHVYHLSHFVREGETISSGAYEKNAGGKGFNQALALKKANQNVHMAGAIGEDGLFLKALLEKAQVNTEHLLVSDAPTGHAMIQVDPQGKNGIVICGAANQSITKDQVDAALSHFESGDYLLMQNEIACGEYLLTKASDMGMQVILNPSPISKDLLSWPFEKAAWLILNEIEGQELTGKANKDDILDTLLSRYPESRIVLTLGSEGSVYADKTQRVAQPSIPAQAVDTTGAGDTFTGYFFASYLRSGDVKDSLLVASQASAIAVGRPGAGEAIPYWDEVMAMLTK